MNHCYRCYGPLRDGFEHEPIGYFCGAERPTERTKRIEWAIRQIEVSIENERQARLSQRAVPGLANAIIAAERDRLFMSDASERNEAISGETLMIWKRAIAGGILGLGMAWGIPSWAQEPQGDSQILGIIRHQRDTALSQASDAVARVVELQGEAQALAKYWKDYVSGLSGGGKEPAPMPVPKPKPEH